MTNQDLRGAVDLMLFPMWFWLGVAPMPSQERSREDRAPVIADVIHITEQHRLRRRQKIIRRLKRGY